jgi:small subunit ribosomal protein S2
MSMPSLRQLFESGAHIGHKKSYSPPGTRRFVYTVKDGLLVINMEKTLEYLEAAIKFLRDVHGQGGTVLFVGTKPQAREALKATALALSQPYVTSRWLGGTLTNFDTVKKSLFQLEELEKKMNDPAFAALSKRERSHIKEKHTKLTEVFEGIAKLTKIPAAMVVVDANYEDIAIQEARRLGVPVVAVMDTNANPDLVDYPIPVNDESKRTIELVMTAIKEGVTKTRTRLDKTAESHEEKRKAKRPAKVNQVKKATRKAMKPVKQRKKKQR